MKQKINMLRLVIVKIKIKKQIMYNNPRCRLFQNNKTSNMNLR